MRVTDIPTVVEELGIVPKCLEKRLKKLGVRGKFESIQTTEMLRSARLLSLDLQRLAVTQNRVKDHQLKLQSKTRKKRNNNYSRTMRKLHETKLHSRNLTKEINPWIVPFVEILETILKDGKFLKGRTTNGLDKKKTHDSA